MTGMDFSIWMALLGCVVGGVRVGLMLAPGASAETPAAIAWDERRMVGVAILAAHIGSAAVLGYGSALGQGMALALSLGWIASAATRFWIARKLGRTAHGAAVDLLTGVVLALPAWSDLARLSRGSII